MSIYDEIADMFFKSLAGQYAAGQGIDRAEFIRRMREHYPTEEAMRAKFEELRREGEVIADAYVAAHKVPNLH